MIARREAPPSANGHSAGLFTHLLDRIGNIWFGVGMLVLIFIYSSIGSAAPPIRQGAMADWTGLEFLRFDKTEMEWFCWWPFQLMLALFCLALILVTVRKIPLTRVNAGVWAIHTGIIILAVSSAVYFGSKVEGDAVIFQSNALILAPGMKEPVSMIVRPGASTEAVGTARMYRVSIQRIDPEYTLMSGPDKGKKTQSIYFNVDSGNTRFMRVVLLGYPEFTEDLITGGDGGLQRAVKVTGQRLFDKDLQIQLGYDQAKYFYHAQAPPVRSTAAIYARFDSGQEWTQLRYQHLPHYYEHLAHRDELWQVPNEAFPKARASLDLQPEVPDGAGDFKKLDVRVTDYLPYANIEQRFVDAGEAGPLNPYIKFRLGSEGTNESHELLASSPDQRRDWLLKDFPADFVWAQTDAERKAAIAEPHPRFTIKVRSKKLERTFPVASVQGKGQTPVEGTDYRIELQGIIDGQKFGFDGKWLAYLSITRGKDVKFSRIVIAGEQGQSIDLDSDRGTHRDLLDKDLEIKFLDPAQQRVLLVAGPTVDSVDLVLTIPSGSTLFPSGLYRHQAAAIGQTVSLVPMMQFTVDQLTPRARSEVRPVIVPVQQREQQPGMENSLVRVEVNDGTGIQSVWLPYSHYAFDDDRWAFGRMHWAPRVVRLSDGRLLQLLYSQWRDPLPAPIALDRFILETHTGGERPADFISLIRFEKDGQWGPLTTVKSNHPTQYGDKWFFQAQWEPNTQSFTVLGVGNRHGVHAMLAGVCISIAGMIYAFYFKPIVIRRRKQAALAQAQERGTLKRKESPARAEVTHV